MTLRVLAGYADGGLTRETYLALTRYVPIGQLEMVNVTGNVSNYWHEFRKRWRGEFDLMTVEQDNVITAEMIPSFNACHKPWCLYEYAGPAIMGADRTIRTGLGCTRFSRQLQKDVPISEISESEYFTWYLIDYRIGLVLERKGLLPHVHGRVEHLHNYPEDESQIAKDKQLQAEGFEITRRNPEAVLVHEGMELKDGQSNEEKNDAPGVLIKEL